MHATYWIPKACRVCDWEPEESAAEDVGVHVYGIACHRMHVLSEASLCCSRPRSGQEPKGPGLPSSLISIPGV